MRQPLFPSKAVNALIAALSIALILIVLFLLGRGRPESVVHAPAVQAESAPVQMQVDPIDGIPVITVTAQAPKNP